MRTPPAILVLRVASLVALAFSAALAADYYGEGHQFCASGGGCELVRDSPIGRHIGLFLPALGMLTFPLLFAGSLIERRATLRAFALLAVVSGLGALVFLVLQGAVIGHWCWLCVGADGSALIAAGAGAWIVKEKLGTDHGWISIASPWWPLFFAALAPIAWAKTMPDPEVPPVVRALWDDGADLNVVEMVDFECPYCRAMHPVLKGVLDEVEADVHVVRVMAPLPFHTHAREGARAYFCAEREGRAEVMADRLFASEDLSRSGILEEARALELDVEAFERCLGERAIDARVDEDVARWREAGTGGLPTVFIGERQLLGFDADAGAAPFEEAVAAALEGDGRRTEWWPFATLLALAIASFLLWRRSASR